MSATTATKPTALRSVKNRLFSDPHVARLGIILVLLLVFFALIKPSNFFGLATWQSMAVQFPEFGLMALGVMLERYPELFELDAPA